MQTAARHRKRGGAITGVAAMLAALVWCGGCDTGESATTPARPGVGAPADVAAPSESAPVAAKPIVPPTPADVAPPRQKPPRLAAPRFSTAALGGAKLDLAGQRGKVVVLDFWATWCPPCVASIPVLKTLHEKYEKQGLVVIGLTTEEPGTVRPFAAKNAMTYALAVGQPIVDVYRKYEIRSLPTTVFIDKKGFVRSYESGFAPGPNGTASHWEATIRQLLAER